MRLFVFFTFFLITKMASAEFFQDISGIIKNNEERLSYGISVTDFNKDGQFEFIVTGFRHPNLALSYKKGFLENLINEEVFSDDIRSTIGVAACDIDNDGFEELYFLNTDTYSGRKQYSDRLLDSQTKIIDLFEIEKNLKSLNLTAGRSVVCVDRNGVGTYGFYVANYGGPTRFYELINNQIIDKAPMLNIDKITGGRAVVSGHILGDQMDIFAANERGPNFLYFNEDGVFKDFAEKLGVEDVFENGRGTTLTDFLYRGELDIVTGNWEGEHRIFLKGDKKFKDVATSAFKTPSRVRTVISADFDNDGYDEIFINNIGEANKFKSEEMRDQYFEAMKDTTPDDVRKNMKNENANFQMNWNNEKNDMVMYCWWKANSPQAILDTLGDMAGMFHNDIKEMSNVMDVTD